MKTIDINSDVGEGVGNEALLMPLLSSCNIACGGHAGNNDIIKEVLAFAKAYKVKVGAHPGYPDKKNFGRVMMDISEKALRKSLFNQITNLKQIAEENGQTLHHVKPHGALYNEAARSPKLAMLLIDTISSIDDKLAIYVPYGSVIEKLAKPVLPTVVEGFADRAYHTDYTLVSRSHPAGVLHKAQNVIDHVMPMILQEQLTTIDGEVLPFKIDTLCVHGDTKNAVQITQALRTQLDLEGITIS